MQTSVYLLSISTGNLIETVINRLNAGHGVMVTLIGLLSVFCGLLVLWTVTANLPRILTLIERITRKESQTAQSKEIVRQPENDFQEIAAAMAVALSLELEEEDISVITMRHVEQEMSPWVVASKSTTMRYF